MERIENINILWLEDKRDTLLVQNVSWNNDDLIKIMGYMKLLSTSR